MIDIDKILSPIPGMPSFSGSNERSTSTSEKAINIILRLNTVKPAKQIAFNSITAEHSDLKDSEEQPADNPALPETTLQVTYRPNEFSTSTTEHTVVLTVEEQRIQDARNLVMDALNNPMRGSQ